MCVSIVSLCVGNKPNSWRKKRKQLNHNTHKTKTPRSFHMFEVKQVPPFFFFFFSHYLSFVTDPSANNNKNKNKNNNNNNNNNNKGR